MTPPRSIDIDGREAPFWREAAPLEPLPETPRLPFEAADILIIGAGYTGLSAALALARAGRSVLTLDADALGSGASARNGGMIGWGHRARLAPLARRYGAEAAREIIAEARRSYEFTLELIRSEGIECRFERTGRYLAAASPKHFRALADEAEALSRQLGMRVEVLDKDAQRAEIATESYVGGLLFPEHGALHPGLLHAGLLRAARAAGATVAGGLPVMGLRREGDGFMVATPAGAVRAREVLFAANGYGGLYSRALGAFARRLAPLPSFLVATERLGRNRVRALMPGGRTYVDTRSSHSYFRADPDGERILWGGRASLTPIGAARGGPRLRAHMASIFPELAETPITHSWTGRIAYTRDTIPHVGQVEGIWHACGYCGSGVAMAPYLGWRVAQKILGAPEGRTGFDAASFSPFPFYAGLPPALRALEAWHRFLDWRDGVVARPPRRG